jgi:hypothetical protein
MPDTKLSLPETTILLLLMAEAREVSNPELAERYQRTLDGKERRRLNDLKLVESWKEGRRYVHVLTDAGWARCAEVIKAGSPPRGARPADRTLFGVLANLPRGLDRHGLSLADLFARDADVAPATAPAPPDQPIEERVRAAYRQLATEPGDWVSLAQLRSLVDDVPKVEMDAVLVRMNRMPDVTFVPESNQKVLTRADREAAVTIGDQDKHLLSIEGQGYDGGA